MCDGSVVKIANLCWHWGSFCMHKLQMTTSIFFGISFELFVELIYSVADATTTTALEIVKDHGSMINNQKDQGLSIDFCNSNL